MTVNSITYSNWSENLTNSTKILYPKNDREIIRLIRQAHQEIRPIRIVGNSHASSPVISNIDENLILVSLEKYELSPKNIEIDPDRMVVRVNAGWKLGQLYDHLNKGLYFLETQPASGAFSIGGLIGTPVHGGRLGGSLMADSIMELTLINGDGKKVTKSVTDEDFNLYRLSFGVLGIITSVTFRIHQMLDVQSNITTFHSMFQFVDDKSKLNRKVLKKFFWERIQYCLAGPDQSPGYFSTDAEIAHSSSKSKKKSSPEITEDTRSDDPLTNNQLKISSDELTDQFIEGVLDGMSEPPELSSNEKQPKKSSFNVISDGSSSDKTVEESDDPETILKKKARYCHCFLDFHNNILMSLDWKELDAVRKYRKDSKESVIISKVSNWFHQKFFANYRQKKLYLKMMGKFVRANIYNAVVANRRDDQDMMWVGIGTRVYFMSYYIPVYTEGQRFSWTKLAKPIEAIMDTIRKFQKEKRLFTIDFPSDLRFVTSSPHTRASPIYSERDRTVYLGIDLTAGPGNIYLKPDADAQKTSCCQSKDFKEKLNADFREFYGTIEAVWRECGGIPHWGKLFGFSQENRHDPGPFNIEMVQNILSTELKETYQKLADPVFSNEFTYKLFQKTESEIKNGSLADIFNMLDEAGFLNDEATLVDEQPVEKPIQQPIQQLAEQPTQQPIQQPVEQPVEQPAEQPVEQPVEQPAEKLTLSQINFEENSSDY